jgi:hypothetical protein
MIMSHEKSTWRDKILSKSVSSAEGNNEEVLVRNEKIRPDYCMPVVVCDLLFFLH